jgi:hypothetical protein
VLRVGADQRLLEPVLGVQADYLHADRDEMRQKFGSIEAYFEEGRNRCRHAATAV